MNQCLKQSKSELLILTIILFIIIIISGSTRISPMLDLLIEPEMMESARISAYISLSISSIFYLLVSFALFCIVNVIFKYSKSDDLYPIFLEGISYYVITLCFFEVLRVLLTFTLFEQAAQKVDDIDLIREQLKESNWWKYDRVLRLIKCISASIIFYFYCRNKKRDMRYILISSIIVLAGILIYEL